MAEAKAAVGAESMDCEVKEASLRMTDTEPELPEQPEEVTPEAAVEEALTQDAPDNKRKLEDLQPLEKDEAPLKKQEICVSEPTSEGSFPAADQVTTATDEAARLIGAQETDGSGHLTTEKPVTVADGMALDSALGSTAVDGNFDEHSGSGLDGDTYGAGNPTTEKPVMSDCTALNTALECTVVDGNVNEHSGQDGETDGADIEHVKMETDTLMNGKISSSDNIQHVSADDTQYPSLTSQQDGLTHARQQTPHDLQSSSQKIEIPNNKVGILIGKSGGTIRYLQINSGAKIQITKDADVSTHSSTRHVELTGSLENINKAEQLIKNVIAEADAGGSPSLVARGFNTPQSGAEQIEMQIPNEKVGMVIGKGGETIKNMQSKTGARIQLIPQHLPEGDASKERTVRITGSKKQVESAKEMIDDVMIQVPSRSSSLSNTFRPPRGPAPVTEWGSCAAAPTQQTMCYGHQQRGMYPPQTSQYPRPYGGYSEQPLPRGSIYGSGWDQQRPAYTPTQTGPQPGGYDYYNQGGVVPTNQPSNHQVVGSVTSSAPAHMNYNYAAQSHQSSDGYEHSYAQQKYGHNSYNEPRYDSQASGQQTYGQQQQQQQPIVSQPGMYGQQSSTACEKPAYGGPYEVPPSYGTSQSVQAGEEMYQGSAPNQYPSSTPMQPQAYPYGLSTAPTQQGPPPYGGGQQAYGQTQTADGLCQQPWGGYPPQQPAAAVVYGGQAVPPPAYGGQPVPQPGGCYSQYPPPSQASYYYDQGGAATDATAYAGNNVPNSGYASQQTVGNQPSDAYPSGYYDQSMPPQSGYGVPAAPLGYANKSGEQPGYGGGQYMI